MTLRSLFATAAIVLAPPAAFAQKTPEATLARFIDLANAGQLTTPEGQAILTGEAKQFATDAKSNLPAADKITTVTPTLAAARIVLRGSGDEEADAYFYLEKTPSGWAVSAYRAMALNGMDMMLLQEMKKRPRLSPEDELQKRNLELILSTDSKLRAWFAANREKLDQLTAAFVKVDNGSDDIDPGIAADLKNLGLSSIHLVDAEVRIIIGGTLDNSVGFLSPGSLGVPRINPESFIWIEDLGGGWFLFRTT